MRRRRENLVFKSVWEAAEGGQIFLRKNYDLRKFMTYLVCGLANLLHKPQIGIRPPLLTVHQISLFPKLNCRAEGALQKSAADTIV